MGVKEVLIKYWGSDAALIIDELGGNTVKGRYVTLDDNDQTPFTRLLDSDLKSGKKNGFFYGGTFHKLTSFSKE